MSTATTSLLVTIANVLSWFMQLSILVPMVVVWRRQAQFPPAVRLLSWYVYLSLLSVIAARSAEFMHQSNLLILTAFNFSKILLFLGVYYMVLQQQVVRQTLAVLTALGLLAGVAIFGWLDTSFLLTFSRTLQCALLAAFALAYLEQLAREPPAGQLRNNPFFLVSVGQLFYSAGTIIFFSFGLAKLTYAQNKIYFGIVAIVGLFFNALLTLAFLRAKPEAPGRRA
jgi:hypothetical protein